MIPENLGQSNYFPIWNWRPLTFNFYLTPHRRVRNPKGGLVNSLTCLLCHAEDAVVLSGAGVQRSGTPAQSKHPYLQNCCG